MTAIVLILPVVRRAPYTPCPRCKGLHFVPFDRMNEAQQRWAPAEAILPCPDCTGPAQVIAFAQAPEGSET